MLIQDQTQTQQQKIDPKIIMANAILQISGVELQQTIEQELTENPALEMEDEEPCSGCELAPFMCKDCQYGQQQQQEDVSVFDLSAEEIAYAFDFTQGTDDEDDPIGHIMADVSLHDHLRDQLRNVASGKLYELGDYLINYINESGYLECDPLEITLEVDASDEEIAEAIATIQTLDPPGVGAKDLQECMLIQLRYLAEDGRGNPVAERIVQECWAEMTGRKVNSIAYRLKVKADQVRQALKFVQTKLNPYPSAGFRPPWDHKPSEVETVRPDVIIARTPTGYEIEIVTNGYPALTVNPYYRQVYNDLRNGKSGKYSEKDRAHIAESVERADLFIKNLNQRRKTLRNITKCIVEQQHGFLTTGSKLFLRPLTRVKVAEMLSIHESTVSRATANKYVQLPSQEVVSFDFFFQSSHSVMDVIEQLMTSEDTSHPLSDQEITEILNERGFAISRRTVAKYRKALKILSSRQRRR